ncbi:MAG: hypothetical protein PVH18_11100 [Chloroflexota bacterium]|jgi:hypothetical protein
MKRMNGQFKFLGWALLLLLILAIPTVIMAQDDAICNPATSRLAEVMVDVDCEDLLDLQAEGYGLGEIMKAWYLAEDLEGFGDWRTLLERKQAEDLGWGQFKMAARLAGEDGDPEALLELKQAGTGWGLIKKAQAVDASGMMSFDEALAMFQSGAEWDEIRAELGLEPGPPPWAGPKDKDKGDNGPPPWANNDKNDKKKDS